MKRNKEERNPHEGSSSISDSHHQDNNNYKDDEVNNNNNNPTKKLKKSKPFNIEDVYGFTACSSTDHYEFLNTIGSGTYGVVNRAKNKITGEIVAVKKIKLLKDVVPKEGFPVTGLREINALLQMKHENLVCAKEVICGSDYNKIFIVMDYMDHTLKDILERYQFSISEIKRLMLQLLSGLNYMHENCWLIHRDLKTSNILLDNHGNLKICDYGLARKYGSPIRDNFTPIVVTLWYRAPELLLGSKYYSTPIDMWSIGCIFYELITSDVLFKGDNEIDQIKRIFSILGKPTSLSEYPKFSELPSIKKFKWNNIDNPKGRLLLYEKLKNKFNLSDNGFDLLNRLLGWDPEQRITAKEALDHPFFKEHPLPQMKENMPTFPSLQVIDEYKRRKSYREDRNYDRDYYDRDNDDRGGYRDNNREDRRGDSSRELMERNEAYRLEHEYKEMMGYNNESYY
ncbi:hypothetical protein ABK040_004503 [Willaertia magna]